MQCSPINMVVKLKVILSNDQWLESYVKRESWVIWYIYEELYKFSEISAQGIFIIIKWVNKLTYWSWDEILSPLTAA